MVTGTSLVFGLWSSHLRVNPNKLWTCILSPAIRCVLSFFFLLPIYVPWRLGARLPNHHVTSHNSVSNTYLANHVSVLLCLFYPTARVFLFISPFLSSLFYQSSLVVDVSPHPTAVFSHPPFLFRVHCRRRPALPVPHWHSPHPVLLAPFFCCA